MRERTKALPALSNEPGMDLIAWQQWLDRHTAWPRELGSVRLLINGEIFYPEFERRVVEAQSSVDVHVCIFVDVMPISAA